MGGMDDDRRTSSANRIDYRRLQMSLRGLLIAMGVCCVVFALVYFKLRNDRQTRLKIVLQEIDWLETERIALTKELSFLREFNAKHPVPSRLKEVEAKLDKKKQELRLDSK